MMILLLLHQILRAKISECRVDRAEILGVKWLCIQGLGTPDFSDNSYWAPGDSSESRALGSD